MMDMLSSPLLPAHEALSGITGVISLASWFLLLLPQLYENYSNQSADGISLVFLAVWFLGDVANLAGALWGNLLPTVIALGVYFCVLDFALIAQTVYYKSRGRRWRWRRRQQQQQRTGSAVGNGHVVGEGGDAEEGADRVVGEEQPLLRQRSHESQGDLPYTRRRSSAASSSQGLHSAAGLPSIDEEEEGESSARMWTKNVLAVVGVCVLGTALWAIAWKVGWWKLPGKEGSEEERVLGAEVLGYVSSVLYLGARIPQIIKNHRERSCDGLSLLFFMLSTLGNATYGAQILFHSVELQYFLKNLPWLIGSLGTISEDLIIFIQFQMYTKKRIEVEDSDSAID